MKVGYIRMTGGSSSCLLICMSTLVSLLLPYFLLFCKNASEVYAKHILVHLPPEPAVKRIKSVSSVSVSVN